jgi:hypothetical protein
MSSDLKVTNIKHESSSSNNLVLASDGNVSITNTLSAGTIGSGVVFPANTIEYINSATVTSDQSNTNSTTTYQPSSLLITIPSATVAKYSKLKISFSWVLRWQSSTYTYVHGKIERSNPSVSTLQELPFQGMQTAVSSYRVAIAGAVIDSSLGSGDHTYKFYAKQSATAYAGTIYLDGTTDSVSWVVAEGIV